MGQNCIRYTIHLGKIPESIHMLHILYHGAAKRPLLAAPPGMLSLRTSMGRALAKVSKARLRVAGRAEREALIAAHSVTVEALRLAETIKREARAECERLRLEADAYALHSLRDLQVHLAQTRRDLDTTLKTVTGGIEMLESRADYAASEPARKGGAD